MESKVALEVGMNKWKPFLTLRRIVCLHTAVETDEEIVEVHAESKPIGCCYLFVEFVETEFSSRLVFVVADCPDVAGIDIGCQFEHPKQFCPVFQVHVQTNVTTLFHEGVHGVVAVETARTERADRPTAHAVGTSGIEPLFKRENRGVAVRNAGSGSNVEYKGVAAVEGVVI